MLPVANSARRATRRHNLALRAEARRASLDSLRQSLERMDTQISHLQQRYLNLSEQIARANQPENHAQGLKWMRCCSNGSKPKPAWGNPGRHVQQLEESYREKDG